MQRRANDWLRLPLLVGFGVGLLIVGYSYFRTKDLISGPTLVVDTPVDGGIATTSLIRVRGSARNIALLSVNGRQVYTDAEGRFDEEVGLPRGYSILEVRARDRLGRESIKHLSVVMK